MRTHLLVGSLALAVLAGTASPATAAGRNSGKGHDTPRAASLSAASTDVPGDGSWVLFSVGETGSHSSEFSFTSAGPVLVTVADFLCRGDRYLVFDGSTVLGPTSQPSPPDGCADSTDNPDEGYADPNFSKGTFAVGSGSHLLRFQIIDSPYGGALSAFKVEPAPTPTTKDDCKRGGWQRLYAANGSTFRNQGQCVSSVTPG